MSEVHEVIQDLLPYLQQVADQLGTTAQYLWQLQIAQAKVVLVTDVIFDLLGFAVFIRDISVLAVVCGE